MRDRCARAPAPHLSPPSPQNEKKSERTLIAAAGRVLVLARVPFGADGPGGQALVPALAALGLAAAGHEDEVKARWKKRRVTSEQGRWPPRPPGRRRPLSPAFCGARAGRPPFLTRGPHCPVQTLPPPPTPHGPCLTSVMTSRELRKRKQPDGCVCLRGARREIKKSASNGFSRPHEPRRLPACRRPCTPFPRRGRPE